VEAERNPQYLKAIARAVEDFRAALTELLALYVPTSEAGLRGLLPPSYRAATLTPKNSLA
jgi:hypothetical protein